jgi:FkbM family methyltransferase
MSLNPWQVKDLLGDRDEITVFEVGCADGRDTKQFLKAFGSNFEIYTFDPEPLNILAMTALGQKDAVGESNDVLIHDNRHEFNPFAICDFDGKITFKRSRDTGYDDGGYMSPRYSGSIKDPVKQLEGWPHIVFDEVVEAEARRLDTFCKDYLINHIDFLWMDVQGAEGQVFAGAPEILKNTDYVYTEYYNVPMYDGQLNLEDLKQILNGFELIGDYRYSDCDGGDALFRKK